MANVTQKISSFIQGISQQPDYLKRSGQVVDLVNALPDVTIGCQKRPGSELIAKLETTKGGKWFTIFRDDYEKYLVQYIDKNIRVWSLLDGTPRVVKYSTDPFVPPEEGNPGGGTGGGGTPNLPPGCNLQALLKAQTDWLSKSSEVKRKLEQYNEQYAEYEKRKNDPLVQVYEKPTIKLTNEFGSSDKLEGKGYYFQKSNVPGAVVDDTIFDLPARSLNVDRTKYSPIDENRGKYGSFKYFTSITSGAGDGASTTRYETTIWPHAYGYTTGTYTPTQIADALASANALYQEFLTLKAEERALGIIFYAESQKCSWDPDLSTRSTRSTPLNLNPIEYFDNVESPDDISVLTVNDYTFITNKRQVVTMGGDLTTKRPYEAFVDLRVLEYNTEYNLDITKPSDAATRAVSYATKLTISPATWKESDGACPFTHIETFDHSDGAKQRLRFEIETRGQAQPKNPDNYDSPYICSYKTYVTLLNGGEGWLTGDTFKVTMQGKSYTVTVAGHSFDTQYNELVAVPPFLTPKNETEGILKPSTILQHFKAEIEKNPLWYADIIGNGLYITGPVPFSIYATGGRTDDSIVCFTNKVNDISKLPSQCKDGYVTKVLNTGERDDDYYVKFIGTEEGVDGTGAWEETVAPGIPRNFNYNTMPHVLTRQSDGSFLLSPLLWEDRLVGDEKTNPEPSFVGNSINKVMFYRNRLVMLSGENLILSRAGDFFNFWSRTAITISDDDPIDLSASGTTPTTLYDGLSLQQGLVLFSDQKQYIFATAQDNLSPQTARIEEVSTYEYNPLAPLIDMGTTIGFLAKSGAYARYFEMVGISDFTPEILEQSKIVPELIKRESTEIAQSKENSLVVMGERGSRDVQLYRYFNDGTKRIQSAWFRWVLTGNLIHHAVNNDRYYLVAEDGNHVVLSRTNLVPTSSEYIIHGTTLSYTPRLDQYTVVGVSGTTYDARTDISTIKVDYPYTTGAHIFGVSQGRNQGRYSTVLDVTPNGALYDITVEGDWTNTQIAVGYNYQMKVVIPHFYITQSKEEQQVSETRGYLTIHRGQFHFGPIGMFDVYIEAPSKPTRHAKFEISPSDSYLANTHEVLPVVFRTIPLYEKASNLGITFTSEHPTPCTLLSMEWEGKFTPKHYQRV
jgi:hypothetical protein